jgi:hypothetical protein
MNPVDIPKDAPWVDGTAVLDRLRGLGHETWFVGGCVRDLLLGRAVHDVDLASAAAPEQIEAAFPKTVAVGKSFGVVVVVTPSGGHVEVASFRSDGAYIDGRRPTEVHPATARADVERRDFTMNALLLGPDGVVVDHVGGRRDLDGRVLRGVGDARARLAEDRLRVVRALRFAARLDMAIAPGTWAAIVGIPLAGLSSERLLQEWDKALAPPSSKAPGARGGFLRLCAASGRLGEITTPLASVPRARLAATARALDRLSAHCAPDAAAAVWLSAAEPGGVAAWLARQPSDRARGRRLSWLVQQIAAWSGRGGRHPWTDAGVAERRRLAMHVDEPALSSAVVALGLPFAGEFVAAAAAEQARGTAGGAWKPLLRGDDLKACGVPAGPDFGRWLRRCEDAELEGRFSDHAGGVALLRQWLAAGYS